MKKNIFSLLDSTDPRVVLPEECALAAAINLPTASQLIFDCLVLQEHRGERGAGIISIQDGRFFYRRRIGSVRSQFDKYDFNNGLPGNTAIGQTRYATAGDPDCLSNVQPLVFEHSRYGPIMIAHNGTLPDHQAIKEELANTGAIFQSGTDSEIFGHLIARSKEPTLELALISACQKIPAAYSLLVFSPTQLFAVRDRHGVRPLSLAKLGEGFLVCSENYAFDQYPECEHLGDVEPGEMIIFEKDKAGFRRETYAQADERFCIFEGIYFSNPRTSYRFFLHEDFRQELGKQIFLENPQLKGDFILPVLDSGKHSAIGLSKASGIPYKEYYLRIHNPPRAQNRSFTSPDIEERRRSAFQKLHLRKDKIVGRDAVVVDDSIVRSTTIKLNIERLRQAGAAKITVCISAPPIINPCLQGMDFQDRKQLVAAHNSIEEIRQSIGADELIYISPQGLHKVVQRTYKCGICSGCFDGNYPV